MPAVGSKWFPDTPTGHREARVFSRENPDMPMREGGGAHVYQSILDREEESLLDSGFDKTASAPSPFPRGTMAGFLDELVKISQRVINDDSKTGWEHASGSVKPVEVTDRAHNKAKARIGNQTSHALAEGLSKLVNNRTLNQVDVPYNRARAAKRAIKSPAGARYIEHTKRTLKRPLEDVSDAWHGRDPKARGPARFKEDMNYYKEEALHEAKSRTREFGKSLSRLRDKLRPGT